MTVALVAVAVVYGLLLVLVLIELGSLGRRVFRLEHPVARWRPGARWIK